MGFANDLPPLSSNEVVPHVSHLRRGSHQGPPPEATHPLYDRLFLLGLLGAIGFILWLPLFPTGDGPVHLYYANVLWSLLQHQPAYAHDYAVRHLFAPYLVHYLALVSFEHFTSPPMAEKLFIAIIFLTQAFGFRFLARTLGPGAPVASLWMLPLLFSWSLGGGFLNCCFATGVALWAYALWVRLGEGAPPARTLPAYAAALAVLVLAHPVPLLVLLLFTASDLLLRTSMRALRPKLATPQALAAPMLALALTGCAFVAPAMLAQKGQAAAVLPEIGFHIDVLGELAAGMRLGYFAGLNPHSAAGWAAIAARVLLVSIVPGVAALLGCQAWRGRNPSPSNRNAEPPSAPVPVAARLLPATAAGRLLLISLVYLAATAWFPRSLNHSFFFPQRMWNIVWLLVLACGSAVSLAARGQRWLAGAGMAAIALTAASGLPALAHLARAQAQLAAVPLPAGGRGLLLGSDASVDGHGAATTYPVYFWAGARAFAASRSVLLNSPWLGLTILPLKDAPRTGNPAHALLDEGFPSVYSENPVTLAHVLRDRPDQRARILARADFFLYVDPVRAAAAPVSALASSATLAPPVAALIGSSEPSAWQCRPYPGAALCTRRQ